MGKIINFVNSCKECTYHRKGGICENKEYKRNMFKILEFGRCPYFKKKIIIVDIAKDDIYGLHQKM